LELLAAFGSKLDQSFMGLVLAVPCLAVHSNGLTQLIAVSGPNEQENRPPAQETGPGLAGACLVLRRSLAGDMPIGDDLPASVSSEFACSIAVAAFGSLTGVISF
jgi:hypothetical protein